MRIDVLYFEGCPNHKPAVDLVRSVADELGLKVETNEVEVRDQSEAERLRFLGSPSIQVEGVDVEPAVRDRTDFAFSCRPYGGQGLPSREVVADALTEAQMNATGGEHDSCCAVSSGGTSADDAPARRAGVLAAGGSVLSALAASACCWLPLLLIAFGVTTGGVAAWFEKYRLVFLGISVLFLASGFYLVYFRQPVCATDAACATPNRKMQRFSRITLWTATIAVIAFAAFPYYVGALIPDNQPAQTRPDDAVIATVTFDIEGMTCEGCVAAVQNALVKVPGVFSASVSLEQKLATVEIDREALPATEPLIQAVEGAGFSAKAALVPLAQESTGDPPERTEPPSEDGEKKVIDLSEDMTELRKAFNDNRGKVRMLLILSPT